MPYFARISPSQNYHPHFVCTPDVGPLLEAMRLKIDARRKPMDSFSPGDMNADVDMPPEAFCTEARETKGFKRFPDVYVSLKYWCAVVQEFKDLVEQFAPGVHQFSAPIALFYKNGMPYEKVYYAMNMRHYLDNTIIMEKSSGPTYTYLGKTTMDPSQHNGTLTLDQAVISRRHFWRANDFLKLWFFSDEFKRAIDKAKFKKLDFTYCRVSLR